MTITRSNHHTNNVNVPKLSPFSPQVRVGHHMLVIGGITATNAKAPKGEDGLLLGESQDVYVLNMKTLVWSQLELLTPSGKAAKLNLHGHSLVSDPYEKGMLYLFGGKDTIDGKRAAMETVVGAKKYQRRGQESHGWVINISEGTVASIPTKNTAPDNRYEHIGVSGNIEGVFLERALPPKRKPDVRLEPLMYIFGGSKVLEQGYCDPIMHQLVRVYTYTNPDLISVPTGVGGSVADVDMNDDHSISTRHTADCSSVYTMQQDYNEDEDDLKQPSIWEKKQLMEMSTGKIAHMHTPTNWGELKLALSSSFTEKRSAHLSSLSPTTTMSVESPERPGTSSRGTEGEESGGSSMVLSAKVQRKKELMRLRALGTIVLPIVKGKSYKNAKEAYFHKFPAPLPARRTYFSGTRGLDKSQSASGLLQKSLK